MAMCTSFRLYVFVWAATVLVFSIWAPGCTQASPYCLRCPNTTAFFSTVREPLPFACLLVNGSFSEAECDKVRTLLPLANLTGICDTRSTEERDPDQGSLTAPIVAKALLLLASAASGLAVYLYLKKKAAFIPESTLEVLVVPLASNSEVTLSTNVSSGERETQV